MTTQPSGPDRPVPYRLTAKAEAALAAAAPEPGAGSDLESYPAAGDDPARWRLMLPEPQTAAELELEPEAGL
jgi:hypothetical protein